MHPDGWMDGWRGMKKDANYGLWNLSKNQRRCRGVPIWYFKSYGDSFNEGTLPNSIYTSSFETHTYQAQFLGSGFSKVSMQE
jgi:hypothetical protein